MFFASWQKMLLSCVRNGDVVLDPQYESPQHYAAEGLAISFLKSRASAVLFVDDDMVFNPKDVNTLRDDPRGFNFDALMGLCLSRNWPHMPLIPQHYEPWNDESLYKIVNQPEPDALYPCAYLGLGFTLVRRRVFEVVSESVGEKSMMFRWSPRGDSEDSTFFTTADTHGCKLGVHSGVCIGHRFPGVWAWDHEQGAAAYRQVEKKCNVSPAVAARVNEARKVISV